MLFYLSSGRVLDGPFAGMKYTRYSVGSSYGAKLLGTYEKELASAVTQLAGERWNLIIDIGAALMAATQVSGQPARF